LLLPAADDDDNDDDDDDDATSSGCGGGVALHAVQHSMVGLASLRNRERVHAVDHGGGHLPGEG
jgi:hypothetical protein